jgi:hypothetical protein
MSKIFRGKPPDPHSKRREGREGGERREEEGRGEKETGWEGSIFQINFYDYSTQFLTCGGISMRHVYPFVTNVGDRRRANEFCWRSAPITPGESPTAGLGIADLQISPTGIHNDD